MTGHPGAQNESSSGVCPFYRVRGDRAHGRRTGGTRRWRDRRCCFVGARSGDTALLFGALTVYALANDVQWSIAAVRLRVDAGLMLIVLASLALRQPFTLQYAREVVGREHWHSPDFVHTNYVISAAWAVAFGVLVLADVVMAYVPALPHSTGIIATVVALIATVKFTSWYPEQRVAKRA
jgi:hypothetical protein